jgi:hypothetical protein
VKKSGGLARKPTFHKIYEKCSFGTAEWGIKKLIPIQSGLSYQEKEREPGGSETPFSLLDGSMLC